MRRAVAWTGGLVILLAAATAAAWMALPRLVETVAVERLAAMGLTPARLTVRGIGVTRMEIADLQVTPALHVGRLVLTYDPLALRLGDLTVEDLDLSVTLGEDGWTAGGLETLLDAAAEDADAEAPPLPLPLALVLPVARLAVTGLRLRVTTAEATYRVTGTARAAPAGDGLAVAGALTAGGGGLSATATVDMVLRQPLLWHTEGTASLALSAENGHLPGVASGLTGQLRARLAGSGGTTAVTLDGPASLGVGTLAEGLKDRLPDTLAEALPLPWTVTLGGLDEGPARLAVQGAVGAADSGALDLSAAGEARLDTPGGRLSLRGRGTATVDRARRLSRLRADTLAVEAIDLRLQDTTWSAFASLSDLHGLPLMATAADSRLVLEAEMVDLPGLKAPRLALSLSGPLRWSGFSLDFGARDGLVEVAGPARLGGIFLPDGLSWPIRASGEAAGLTLALAVDGPPTLVPDLTVGHPALLARSGAGATGTAVRAAFAEGTVKGVVPLDGGPATTLDIHLGDGTVGAVGTTLDKVAAALSLSAEGYHATAQAAIPLLPGERAPLPRAARALRPYRLTVTAEGDAGLAAATFSATLRDAPGQTLLSATGRHDFASGQGSARLRSPRRTYAADGPGPADYYTPLGDGGLRLTGTLGARGTVAWTADRLTPRLDLLLEDVGVARGFLALDRVNGVIRLTGLWPPRTPPDQSLAVAALRAGLPLTDGLARFRLDGAGNLVLDEATLHLAGGTLRAGPATLPLDASAGALTLEATAVDLDRLVALIDLPGLDATGTLDGTVPVRLAAGDAIIRDGRLAARDGGRLRYAPDDAPAALASGGQGTDLLMRALADFRYKTLVLTVNGAASDDLEVALHLEGANPALYDGYPVAFNLTVSGALSQIISDSLRGYQVPDRIRERLQGFSAAP
jgi:hypothetical protein